MASHLKNNALAALVPVVFIMMSFSGKAVAETATDDVEVYAGLMPIMKLECTDLKLGVWRLTLGSSGNEFRIGVDRNNNPLIAFPSGNPWLNKKGVSLSQEPNAAPQIGQCNLTGSAAAEGVIAIPRAFQTGTGGDVNRSEMLSHQMSEYSLNDLTLVAVSADNVYADLPQPVDLNKTFKFTVRIPTGSFIDADGAASFVVWGDFIISRQTVDNTIFGGYVSESPVSILIDDRVGGLLEWNP